MKEYQVFSTMSPKRWRAVVWTGRAILAFVLVGVAVIAFSLLRPNKPELPTNFSACLLSTEQLANDTTICWGKQGVATEGCCGRHEPKHLDPLSILARTPILKQIRAGFYVNWDKQSYYSLAKNIGKLNMVVPEWFTITGADTVFCQIDTAVYTNILQKNATVSVMPTLVRSFESNREDVRLNIRRILNDAKFGESYIESIVKTLKKYNFQGITVNFIPEPLDVQNFHRFMSKLQNRLHTEGLLLSQCVAPFDSEFDLKKENTYNDFVFITAFNQTDPAPVADQKWVEGLMDDVAKLMSPEKVVWCMPSFGLDFSKKGERPEELAYRQALAIAQEAKAKVLFNTTTYNLEFAYSDANNVPHKVFFADAATNFNQMRTAENYGWKGVAMWRLGAEDPRVWQFYDKDLSFEALKNGSFDAKTLQTAIVPDDVDYIADRSEIMSVSNTPTEGVIRFVVDPTSGYISEENYDVLPTSYVIERYEKSNDDIKADKRLVLTFDDGPDEKYTNQILDILEKEQTPAAFFLIGKNVDNNPKVVERIFNDGHEIGNHTYWHPDIAHVWDMRAEAELILTRRSIESITGASTLLFRPPYNQFANPKTKEELTPFLLARKHNYLTVSESIDPLDWEKGIAAAQILARVKEKVNNNYGHIILLHDAGGKREATVEALPQIIKYYRSQGYSFVSLSDLMGKKRAEIMPILQENQYFLTKMNRIIAETMMTINGALDWIFNVAVGLAIFRILFIFFFAIKQYLKDKKQNLPDFSPPLSIIVPAYNEEVGAVSTVNSLLNQNYPHFEVVFVDDGSKDRTYEMVKAAFAGDKRVKVLTKTNGGKASALNFGLKKCSHDFVVCIDADTQLDPNALKELAKPFVDPQVGAVAGNVRVGNEVNMLTKWQSIEYITAQNFDRLAFAYLNCITVVPGAIGAFRREAIGSVGLYETDTLAEDCDLTMRIIRKGYRVAQNNKAIAITESPENFAQFMKQRFRWVFGVMQAFWKSKHVLFNKHYGSLGLVAFPNVLIFGMILPLFAPIADMVLILSIVSNIINAFTAPVNAIISEPSFYEKYHTIILYAAFMSIDLAVCVVSFLIQKEPLGKLWLLFPQRIVYRPLMYYVLFKSYLKALKGELMGWGVLKRTGNIGQAKPAISWSGMLQTQGGRTTTINEDTPQYPAQNGLIQVNTSPQ